MSIIAVGTDRVMEVFKILGIDVHIMESFHEREIAEVVTKILEHNVAILDEKTYKAVRANLEKVPLKRRYPPLLVVVPTLKEHGTSRLRELHEAVSLAVGVKVKWEK